LGALGLFFELYVLCRDVLQEHPAVGAEDNFITNIYLFSLKAYLTQIYSPKAKYTAFADGTKSPYLS